MERLLFLILIWNFNLSSNYINHSGNNDQYSTSGTRNHQIDSRLSEGKCLDCHGNLMEHKITHPSKDHCEDCHQSNGEKHPQNDIEGFIFTKKMPMLCLNCHDLIKKEKVLHKPIIDGNCMICHDAHQSDNPKLLLNEEKELCLNCHNKTIPTETRKISNIKQLLKKGNFIHSAIDSGCSVCHSPHASDNTLRLVEHFPGKEYVQASTDSFALCFSCHDRKLFEEAVTQTATNFRIGNQNLHYLHVNRKKGRNCSICHNVHGSANKFQINEKVQFGKWEMKMKFTLLENGGSCSRGCHVEKKYDRSGTPKVDSLPDNWSNKRNKQHLENSSDSDNNVRLKEFNDLKFSDIKFLFATVQIVEGTDKELINVIKFMKKYPDSKIEIKGFTDNVGENATNKILSQQRAEKVKQLIVDQGINHYRMYTIGYGSSKPVASNNIEVGRAKNRRVEITLVQ